jgi:hypothetical protein
MSLSTRVIGTQVLRDNLGNTYSVDALDVTSIDMELTNMFNFGINVIQRWQRRTNWMTSTEWTSNSEWSHFLNGAWSNGNWTSYEWCTIQAHEFTLDLLENFFLEIRGIVCETAEDGDETDWYSSFENNDEDTLGTRYGSDIVSINDIIDYLPESIELNDLLQETTIIYLSYNWDWDDIDSGCNSELDVYTVPAVTFSSQTYK